ncbi:hypothetical protein NMG60_11014152 [Bertholletia excelsa]
MNMSLKVVVSAAARGGFRRGEPGESHRGSTDRLRRLVYRLKSQWRQALRRERGCGCTALYSYDIQSYFRNFDDGCCLDERVSPLAPR